MTRMPWWYQTNLPGWIPPSLQGEDQEPPSESLLPPRQEHTPFSRRH